MSSLSPGVQGLQAKVHLLIDIPIYEFRPDSFLLRQGLIVSCKGQDVRPGSVASVEHISAVGPGQTAVCLHCPMAVATKLQRAYEGGGRRYTHHGAYRVIQDAAD
jgi:hypothetical protein